jgi:hypothetical protein
MKETIKTLQQIRSDTVKSTLEAYGCISIRNKDQLGLCKQKTIQLKRDFAETENKLSSDYSLVVRNVKLCLIKKIYITAYFGDRDMFFLLFL